jgi:2,3-dihydroxybenzoate-AMP ligase
MTETTAPLAAPAETAAGRLSTGVVPFPAELVDHYLDTGVWGRHGLAQEFRLVAERHPERPALVCGEVTWTYAELDRLADARAAGLIGLGLEPGSAVLLQVDNTAEAVLTWYALLKAGLVPVCTLSIHRRHEIGAIASQVTPSGSTSSSSPAAWPRRASTPGTC